VTEREKQISLQESSPPKEKAAARFDLAAADD